MKSTSIAENGRRHGISTQIGGHLVRSNILDFADHREYDLDGGSEEVVGGDLNADMLSCHLNMEKKEALLMMLKVRKLYQLFQKRLAQGQ